MISAAPTASATIPPTAAIRQARLTLRSDVEITRQWQNDEAVYVAHDPISFRSHRLTLFQYRVLSSINPHLTLEDCFRQLEATATEPPEEGEFFEIVESFVRLRLVTGQQRNAAALLKQRQLIDAAKRRNRLLGILFLQIPLARPDAFLKQSLPAVSWLFTRTFVCIWLAAIAASCLILASRWSEIIQPLNSVLAAGNLPFLWITFVGLKVWHELGHGYACRKFGGCVPEMGTILIAGTPAAYVDATAAWSFPRKQHRLMVMLGGMYFESLVFIPSVFLWAFSDSSMVSSCAYQLIVMTSVVTILFNINPLMRFDGYFILSELTGQRNLRSRAEAQIRNLLSSAFLGIQIESREENRGTALFLVAYGIASSIYRITLVISIAAMVAMKFPVVGLSVAAFYLLTTIGGGLRRMTSFLLFSPETEPVRNRARVVAAVLLIGVPLAACTVPIPFGVTVQGIVAAEDEHYLNVSTPGIFRTPLMKSGEPVDRNAVVVQLQNDRLEDEFEIARTMLKNAIERRRILQDTDHVAAARELSTVAELQRRYSLTRQRVQGLTIRAPVSGVPGRITDQRSSGMFLSEGTPVAVIVSGQPRLRTWIDEAQLGSIQHKVDTKISFRVPGRSTETYSGRIVSIKPAAEETFQQAALMHVTGGDIVVNPTTGKPLRPLFRIDIETNEEIVGLTEYGRRVSLRFPRRYETVAGWAIRRCLRFVQQMLVA